MKWKLMHKGRLCRTAYSADLCKTSARKAYINHNYHLDFEIIDTSGKAWATCTKLDGAGRFVWERQS